MMVSNPSMWEHPMRKTKATSNVHPSIGFGARALSLFVGISAAALGCYGAFDFAVKLDGYSYLALAAPLVAAAAPIIPPVAMRAWAARRYFDSIVLWLALVPATLTVFFAAAERTHYANAGAAAERAAAHASASRAESDLADAKAAAKTATAAADKVRGLDAKACGPKCQSIRASEMAAAGRLADAERALRKAQGQSQAEASLKPPVWLLPVALDLVAFAFIACGLGAHRKAEPTPVPNGKVRSKSKGKGRAKPRPAPTTPGKVMPRPTPATSIVLPLKVASRNR
jgi:hypothetical protein